LIRAGENPYVSKIVNWGHWIVRLLACAIAVESIWANLYNTVSMGRGHGETFGARILNANVLFFLRRSCDRAVRVGDLPMAFVGICSGARDFRARVICRSHGYDGW
jgi:hypothetical protein